MRHRVLLILLSATVLTGEACQAAGRSPVTLRARDTSVQPLLRTLLELGGCSYVIGADVPDDRIRSVAIVDVPFDVALMALSRSWRFRCAFEERLCSVTGTGSDIRSSPSGIADPERTEKDKNTYYLVRDRLAGDRQDTPSRISLGPRKERIVPAMIEYAGMVSRLVTPEILDDLAMRLARQVEQNPYLRQRLACEQIGLAQFRPILRHAQDDRGSAQDDRESRNVVVDLAEDLSTSMIRAGFNLVERAQLDKACEELRLQDTALIDPVTASRLGQMTGCGVIVVGSISDRGGLIVINARLVETATGRALAADRVQIRR